MLLRPLLESSDSLLLLGLVGLALAGAAAGGTFPQARRGAHVLIGLAACITRGAFSLGFRRSLLVGTAVLRRSLHVRENEKPIGIGAELAVENPRQPRPHIHWDVRHVTDEDRSDALLAGHIGLVGGAGDEPVIHVLPALCVVEHVDHLWSAGELRPEILQEVIEEGVVGEEAGRDDRSGIDLNVGHVFILGQCFSPQSSLCTLLSILYTMFDYMSSLYHKRKNTLILLIRQSFIYKIYFQDCSTVKSPTLVRRIWSARAGVFKSAPSLFAMPRA